MTCIEAKALWLSLTAFIKEFLTATSCLRLFLSSSFGATHFDRQIGVTSHHSFPTVGVHLRGCRAPALLTCPHVHLSHDTTSALVAPLVLCQNREPGLIPIRTPDVLGCDMISQFQSDLVNEGFYTDSNGWRDVHRT